MSNDLQAFLREARNQKLSMGARLCLVYLQTNPALRGHQLAAEMGVSERQVWKYLAELRKSGLRLLVLNDSSVSNRSVTLSNSSVDKGNALNDSSGEAVSNLNNGSGQIESFSPPLSPHTPLSPTHQNNSSITNDNPAAAVLTVNALDGERHLTEAEVQSIEWAAQEFCRSQLINSADYGWLRKVFLAGMSPAAFREIVANCARGNLRKDPAWRVNTLAYFRGALDDALAVASPSAPVEEQPVSRTDPATRKLCEELARDRDLMTEAVLAEMVRNLPPEYLVGTTRAAPVGVRH